MHSTQYSNLRIQNSKLRIQNSKLKTQNSEFRIQNSKLQMYNLAVCRSGSFHDRLADSRVRMNTGYDFVAGSFEFTGGDGFGDDFGHVVSDHMATEPFAVLGVKNDFDKTLRRTSSFCFSRGSEWKLTYFNLKSRFAGLFLCVAYRSYFWDAVSTRWDVVVIHRGRGLSGNFFSADNPLRAGH